MISCSSEVRFPRNPRGSRVLRLVERLAACAVGVLATGLLWSSAAALAPCELLRADEPAGVEPAPIPDAAPALKAAARDGVFYPLVESQIGWDGDRRLVYYRTVTEVTDRAGLELAATVSSDFDPESERLTLVRLDVIRGGSAISYRDTLPDEVFRRETRLDAGIIDGTLTAHLQVPGLRVGDLGD